MSRFLFSLVLLGVSILFYPASAQDTDVAAKQKLLDRAVKEKNYQVATEIAFQLGEHYQQQANPTTAQKFLTQALGLSKKGNLQEYSLKSSHLLAQIYFDNKDFSNAADYFIRSAQLASAGKHLNEAFENYVMGGESLARLKRFKKAIEPVEEALQIATDNKSNDKQERCYRILAEYYTASGNDRKAAEINSLLATLAELKEKEAAAKAQASEFREQAIQAAQERNEHASILTAQKERLSEQDQRLKVTEESLREVEAQNARSQLEIDLLSKDRELAMLRIQEQSTRLEHEAMFRNSILVVTLLALSLVGVLVINYRKKIKTNKKIDLQNKNIKSSINYAKRIQEAMLPKQDIHEGLLKNSFILFRPRDVVSGDFYWFSTLDHDHGTDHVFGAIDCTGHGVPGAFMSMIGMNTLNSIVGRGITRTNTILETLHREIRNALRQDVTGNNDGMDVSLCIYRPQRKMLEFSGAKSPLVYIQDGTLHQIKGDLHAIGGSKSKPVIQYKRHEVSIEKPTMVYLYTDGFRDQFGGEENQKFLGKRFTALLAQIHHLPLQEQLDTLNSTFDKWKGQGDQTDDVLVLGVYLDPQN